MSKLIKQLNKVLNNPPKIVTCSCGKSQPDQGRGHACEKCGTSPLPSYQYPKDWPFYPKEK